MTTFITKGVPRLPKPDSISVCLPPGFRRCLLAIGRNGETHWKLLAISRKVAAELIASGLAFQG